MKAHSRKTSVTNPFYRTLILILLVGTLVFPPTGNTHAATSSRIYVNANAAGMNNGTSWTNAYTGLQSALTAAISGDEIWVAAGTYTPGTAKSATFQLKSGVALYGGFTGNETTIDQRDPKDNVTILSGEIGAPSNMGDNIYHVVTASGTNETAVLDGFTITAGNASGDILMFHGGGIRNQTGSPTLSNLIISGNAANYGGGMYSENNASPILTNVTFRNNSADRAGGMYNNFNSNAILVDVTFDSNSADLRGGGMVTAGSSPMLTNVTFYGNSAPKGGGLDNLYDGNPVLTHVTFSGNSASEAGGAIYNQDSTPVITNSILYNNNGGEIYNSNSTPVVNHSIVKGGYGTDNFDKDPLLGPLQENGGFTKTMALAAGSPAIDAADTTSCPATDQHGLSRPQGVGCDLGAYEVDIDPPHTNLDSHPIDVDSNDTATFTFSGSDPGGSGVKSFMCRVDTDDYNPCTSPFVSSGLAEGLHTFNVYAIDNNSNNDPTPASYTWRVQFPRTRVLSILLADISPTSLDTVTFTVTFSSAVTNVDVTDFAPVADGISGASVMNVTGTGDTYTVQVNSGTGNGTLYIVLPSQADIVDSYGNVPINLPYAGNDHYSIIKTGTFADVPNNHWSWRYIESLYHSGITSGCGTSPLQFCPDKTVSRDQMAVFLLKGKHTSGYTPPKGRGSMFQDVPQGHWAVDWIEELAAEGITSGCSLPSEKFCPSTSVTRAQMAIFLLKARYGSDYKPPEATGIFEDVPVSSPAAPWIEQLAAEGITGGCSVSPKLYCPAKAVTRDQMAVFLDRAFGLTPLP